MIIISKIVKLALSLPKTVYVNLKTFPIYQAMKFPILVDYKTHLRGIHKNCMVITGNVTPFMIKYGFQDGTLGVPLTNDRNYLVFGKKGQAIFAGCAQFGRGISVRIDSGTIVFGENFTCNKSCFFAANRKISFGNNVLVGWNTNIRDMDGHKVWGRDDEACIPTNDERKVIIGDNVWIAAHVDILKGSEIPSGCIVAYRACVLGKFTEENCIIAGFPAKVVKTNISWK